MPSTEYKVISSRSKSYINEFGQVVNGFEINFTATTFHEVFTINVPSMNKELVQRAIEALIADRKNIATL